MRLLLFFLVFLSIGCLAQTTRTILSGRLKDESGSAVIGVSITLTHVPTNTVYGCASNIAGGYLMADIRSGGPYLLEIKSVGFKPYRLADFFLKIDEDRVIDIILKEEVTVLNDLLVAIPRKSNVLKAISTTGLLNIAKDQISMLPTIKRGIADFTRLSPLSFGAAIAGGNYRQNFLTIDGSEFNNNFGVGDNLPGNGAQPIALDAISEISVNPAPYSSIWESGFIGGAINIVSRSGSNHTEASAYSFFRNQNTQGYSIGSQKLDKHAFNYSLNGFRIGGPILKNKLFYFISYEQEREVYQPQVFKAATDLQPYGSRPNIARPTSAELDNISDYLFRTYGYQAGSYQDYDFINKNYKFLIRADWNIAKNNTVSFRYNKLNSNKPELLNGSRSPLVPFAASSGRRGINALPFSNTNFETRSDFYSLSVEWDSRLSASLSNMLRTSYTGQFEKRNANSEPFPFVDILKDGIPFTSFGYEPFSYNNKRKVDLFSITDIVHWKPGKNSWEFGFQTDYINTENSYMPFGSGYYTFSSWDDFVSSKKPIDYAITYPTEKSEPLPAYSFNYLNIALFMQHAVVLGSKASLTAGLRGDLSVFPKSIPENLAISKLVFNGGKQISTSKLPTSALLLAPRLSFKYDFFDNHSLSLRIGSGIFTGRIPFVWVISQARYSGVKQISQTWQGQTNTPFAFNPAYGDQININTKDVLPSVVSVLSDDFKMPQSWKSGIGFDTQLPGGFKATLETFYNRDIRSILFQDLNLVQPAHLNLSGYPDQRLVYPQKNTDKFINPLNASGLPDSKGNSALNVVSISNASGGYYFSALAAVSKKFRNELSLSFFYVKAFAKSYNDGDGDQTLSALNATPSVNGINSPELSYAGYVVPDRIVFTLTYPLKLTKRVGLNLGIVYQGSSEGRFSYTYGRDLVGDGTNRSLIYVPKDATEISFEPLTLTQNGRITTYSAEQQSGLFFAYINQDKYLRTRKGNYAERNGALFPWRHQLDLRVATQVKVGTNNTSHSIEIGVDIINAGNLLNHNWGLRKLVNSSAILVPVNLDKVSSGGDVKPKFNISSIGGAPVSQTFRNDISLNSTYSLQIGIRYFFE
ncbi:carboxypeptidase regulatory-like domain-containing protein [Pedobacter fastidiosus]|uniref:TonB-dependent receptor n=1 Tax=Pedobacter fastidiosus TaxID=2765361 RepID=A0ABR7KX55_9SPHI|nr:carboxypeptidase regulatory-like domain-containing protein [Pedobacter fastidiosus]MBC6112695.1 TonB-dependent receptor [Pedobacter fastidiosus]